MSELDALVTPEVKRWLEDDREVGVDDVGRAHSLSCFLSVGTANRSGHELLAAMESAHRCFNGCFDTFTDEYRELWLLSQIDGLVWGAAGIPGEVWRGPSEHQLEGALTVEPLVTMRSGVTARVAELGREFREWAGGDGGRAALELWARVESVRDRIDQYQVNGAVDQVTGTASAPVTPAGLFQVAFGASRWPLTLEEARECDGTSELVDIIESAPEPVRGGRLLAAGSGMDWSRVTGGGVLVTVLPPAVRGVRDVRVLPSELTGLTSRLPSAVVVDPLDSPAVLEVACVLAADGLDLGEALAAGRAIEGGVR